MSDECTCPNCQHTRQTLDCESFGCDRPATVWDAVTGKWRCLFCHAKRIQELGDYRQRRIDQDYERRWSR